MCVRAYASPREGVAGEMMKIIRVRSKHAPSSPFPPTGKLPRDRTKKRLFIQRKLSARKPRQTVARATRPKGWFQCVNTSSPYLLSLSTRSTCVVWVMTEHPTKLSRYHRHTDIASTSCLLFSVVTQCKKSKIIFMRHAT